MRSPKMSASGDITTDACIAARSSRGRPFVAQQNMTLAGVELLSCCSTMPEILKAQRRPPGTGRRNRYRSRTGAHAAHPRARLAQFPATAVGSRDAGSPIRRRRWKGPGSASWILARPRRDCGCSKNGRIGRGRRGESSHGTFRCRADQEQPHSSGGRRSRRDRTRAAPRESRSKSKCARAPKSKTRWMCGAARVLLDNMTPEQAAQRNSISSAGARRRNFQAASRSKMFAPMPRLVPISFPPARSPIPRPPSISTAESMPFDLERVRAALPGRRIDGWRQRRRR